MKSAAKTAHTALLFSACLLTAQPAISGCDSPMPNWDRNTSFLRYTPFYIESCPMAGRPTIDFGQKNDSVFNANLTLKPYDNSAQMLRDAKWVVVAQAVAAHEWRKPHAPTFNEEAVVFFKVERILKGQASWDTMPISGLDAARQEASYSGEGTTAKYLGPIPYQHAFNVPALKMLPVVRHSAFWQINEDMVPRDKSIKPSDWVRYITYPAQLLQLPGQLPELKAVFLDETRPFPYQRYATAGAGRSVALDLPYVLHNERYVIVLDEQAYAQNRKTPGAPRVEHVGTDERWLKWVMQQLKTP